MEGFRQGGLEVGRRDPFEQGHKGGIYDDHLILGVVNNVFGLLGRQTDIDGMADRSCRALASCLVRRYMAPKVYS